MAGRLDKFLHFRLPKTVQLYIVLIVFSEADMIG